MSQPEFESWIAYNRIEPLPDPYWIGAQIAWVCAQIWSKKKMRIEDFIPRAKQRRGQSVEEMMSGFMGGPE